MNQNIGPMIIIGVLLVGWVLGIIDTLITVWIKRQVRQGIIHSLAMVICLLAVSVPIAIICIFMVTGIAIGSLLSTVAILAQLDVSFWTPPLIGVFIGFITAIWYLNREKPVPASIE